MVYQTKGWIFNMCNRYIAYKFIETSVKNNFVYSTNGISYKYNICSEMYEKNNMHRAKITKKNLAW